MSDMLMQQLLPSLLRAKGHADITVCGVSMEPLLKQGDRITVVSADDYAVGEVLVYTYKGVLLVHRLLFVRNGRCFCKGDNALRLEDLPATEILGRVVAVNGQTIPPWPPWKQEVSLAVHRLFRENGYDVARTLSSDLYNVYQHLILQKETTTMHYQTNQTMDHIRPDDKALVVFDPESSNTYFFDETGSDILSILATPITFDDLLEKLCTIYDATPADIRDDVAEFLTDAVQKKVVVIS